MSPLASPCKPLDRRATARTPRSSRISNLNPIHVDDATGTTSALARSGGRSEGELAAARAAGSEDPEIAAALRFAAKIVTHGGHLPAADVSALRDAGFSDGEVANVVAVVALNMYRSYFNLIARPEVDFPLVTAGGRP